MFAQKREKFLPLAGRTRGDLFEEQATGGIEDDGIIREPPIHVDGAAHALKVILHSGGKAHVAMPDRFGFSRGGLADDHVPRQFVKILARGIELIEPLLKAIAQIFDPRLARGIVDRGRRGLGVLLKLASEGGRFRLSPVLEDVRIDAEDYDNEKDTNADDQRYRRAESHADPDEAQRAQEIDGIPKPRRKVDERTEEREQLADD